MPTTSTAMPVMLQETQQPQLQSSSRYYMLQTAPVIPAVPVLNTTYIYPRYGFVPKPVETSVTKDEIERTQPTQVFELSQPVQHVVHHQVQSCGTKTCPGYCELCCPWTEQPRARSTSPELNEHHHHHHHHHRHSRRDEFERDELDQTHPSKHETIDEKIERIRRELRDNSLPRRDQSTNTTDIIEHHHIHPRSRSNSRPRSASATRGAWRSSNQNDYPWRDSHLPAYREATFARAQTPVDDSRVWKETAHERSHQNTKHPTTYYSKKDYVYRPKSEVEARKYYVQSTGKDPDREVQQKLRGGTTTYKYNDTATSYYDKHQSTNYDHSFYSDLPKSTTTKTHTLRKIDSTNHHNLYACNEPCLHVVPKTGSTSDPPYMKILNAPVTYLH
ncbi:unnamed protein product [Rotaria magnacalcarata]|nr:unnamed protein product [Rotaria magnacalcarata]